MLGEVARCKDGKAALSEVGRGKDGEVALGKVACYVTIKAILVKNHVRIGRSLQGGNIVQSGGGFKNYRSGLGI